MLQSPRYASRTLVYCGLLLAASMASAHAGDPTGDWRVADGVANIRVAECHGSMWGAVAWEKIPGGRDKLNPDATKRSRLTLGMPILLDMKKKPNADQWEGHVYNAKDGKLYESSITLNSPDELEIEGCVLGFLCGGETWTRVSAPIPSSPSNTVADAAPTAAPKGVAPKGAATKGHAAVPPPAAKSPAATGAAKNTTKAAPKTIGQKGSADTAETPDPVGDICLLPGIARTTH